MVQRLRLDRPQHGRSAALPPIGMGELADQIFVTTLAMTEQRTKIALRTGRHEQPGLETQRCGQGFLQAIDAGVIAIHIVAQRSSQHRRAHRRRRLSDGVTAKVDQIHLQFARLRKFFSIA